MHGSAHCEAAAHAHLAEQHHHSAQAQPPSWQAAARQLPPTPWMLQFSSHLASGVPNAQQSKCQVSAAYTLHTEAHLVEDWLGELAVLRADTRAVCEGLLSRNPSLLYHPEPGRITATVQVLADSIREKGLMRPWFFSDKLVLQLVERYKPDALRARLSQLHADVWSHLDDATVMALVYGVQARSALDLLDLDARALAAKAHKLRGLVPHVRASTMLRAVPELQDVEPEELPACVQAAGLLAIVSHPAAARSLALRALPNNTVQLLYRRAPSPRAGSSYEFESDLSCAPEELGAVIATLPNARAVVYVDALMNIDVRFDASATSMDASMGREALAGAGVDAAVQPRALARAEVAEERLHRHVPVAAYAGAM